MSLEICNLSVFEMTIALIVSKRSLTQFTVNKRYQLVRLILDQPYSFCNFELAQLYICGQLELFMFILERGTSIVFSVHSLSSLKKLILHD